MSGEDGTVLLEVMDAAKAALGGRCLVLVGLMGAGKSVIGRMVAGHLGLPFIDSDHEIERVSRMTIAELFELYGEEEFRSLEARVIARLMKSGPQVLSTGGGAFIDADDEGADQERGRLALAEGGFRCPVGAGQEARQPAAAAHRRPAADASHADGAPLSRLCGGGPRGAVARCEEGNRGGRGHRGAGPVWSTDHERGVAGTCAR